MSGRRHRRPSPRASLTPGVAAAGSGTSCHAAVERSERADRKLEERAAALSALETPLAEHRLAALDLYADPRVAAKLRDAAAARREIDALLAFSTALTAARPKTIAARDATVALVAPLAADGAVPGTEAELKVRAEHLTGTLNRLRRVLAAAPDPFTIGDDERAADGFATIVDRFPRGFDGDPAAVARGAMRVLDDLAAAAEHADGRLAGRAARIVKRVRLGAKKG